MCKCIYEECAKFKKKYPELCPEHMNTASNLLRGAFQKAMSSKKNATQIDIIAQIDIL